MFIRPKDTGTGFGFMGILKCVVIEAVLLIIYAYALVADYLKDIILPIFRFTLASSPPKIVRTPQANFDNLENAGYTFQAKYFELPIGGGVSLPRIHYIDEGKPDSDRCMLLLHGDPTWSFLFRKMIPSLVSSGHRVIAPDMIGFGKSDKYTCMEDYTHQLHTMSLRMLLDKLELHNITLVCQDWGGVIGLSILKDMPDLFSSVVVMNTSLPVGNSIFDNLGDVRDKRDTVFHGIMRETPNMLKKTFCSLFGTMVPLSFIFQNFAQLKSEVVAGYLAPFPSALHKAGVAKWPLLRPMFKDEAMAVEMIAVRNFLRTWTKPFLVLAGDADVLTIDQSRLFKNLIDQVKISIVSGGGHLLPETHADTVTSTIQLFVENKL